MRMATNRGFFRSALQFDFIDRERTSMRLIAIGVSLGCVIAAGGCHRNGDAGRTPGSTAAGRPEAIAEAKLLRGGVICPLESVSGNSIRQSRSFRSGSRATLVGWSRVADLHEPTPPLVHVVFRSIVPDGSPDLFWSGLRVPRPDLAQADAVLATAGYAASGPLPANPGKYKVLVWVGDENVQRECDTGEVFDLHG
jgi:hypothetical protein